MVAINRGDETRDIEIAVYCENLPKMDAFSNSDPMVVAYIEVDGEMKKIGRTEAIKDSLNPKFVETFKVGFTTAKSQRMKFEVYDVDSFDHLDNIDEQELIGTVQFELAELVTAANKLMSYPILHPEYLSGLCLG